MVTYFSSLIIVKTDFFNFFKKNFEVFVWNFFFFLVLIKINYSKNLFLYDFQDMNSDKKLFVNKRKKIYENELDFFNLLLHNLIIN